MRGALKNRVRALLLCLLAGSITIGLQAYVGSSTIYSKDVELKRQELHRAILANQPPNGSSCYDAGALTMNVRVGAVYLAEGVRIVTRLPLSVVYIMLDTLFLFVSLIGLFLYLRMWHSDTYSLIGLLYFTSILPLSYFLHYFHPYDRMQLALWILLLYLICKDKPVLLGAMLVLGMLVKYDVIVLPGLYFIAHVNRENWKRISIASLALSAVVIGSYIGLSAYFPAGIHDPPRFHYGTAWHLALENVDLFVSKNVAMPPLLVHVIPLSLAVYQIRRRDRFSQASVLFAIGLLALYFLFSRFDEVRAQLMILVLLLPAALSTLRSLLERSPDTTADVERSTGY